MGCAVGSRGKHSQEVERVRVSVETVRREWFSPQTSPDFRITLEMPVEPSLWTTPSASVLFSPHQAAKTLSFSLEPLVHGTTPDAIL